MSFEHYEGQVVLHRCSWQWHIGSATWDLEQLTQGCSVPQFPHEDGRSVGEGGCSRLGSWQGKGQGEQPGKGQGWGAQGYLGVIPRQPWLSPSKLPLNNSSAFKLGWCLWRPACVVFPALVAPPCCGGRAGHPTKGHMGQGFSPARDVLGSLESHICCLLKIGCWGYVLNGAPQKWLSLPTPDKMLW